MCALRFPFSSVSKATLIDLWRQELTELPKTNIRDVDNVVTLTDWSFGVGAVRDGRAQGQNETTHVFVQSEKTHHLGRLLGCRQGGLAFLGRGIGYHGLVVDLGDLKEIDGNSSLVTAAKPLRVQSPGGIVLVDVNGVIEGFQLILLAPVLGVLQLVESFLREKLAGSQVAEQSLVIVARGCRASGRSVVFLRLAKVLELLQSVELVLGEVSYVAGWVLVGRLELGSVVAWRGIAGVCTYLVGFDPFELSAVWSGRHVGWYCGVEGAEVMSVSERCITGRSWMM